MFNQNRFRIKCPEEKQEELAVNTALHLPALQTRSRSIPLGMICPIFLVKVVWNTMSVLIINCAGWTLPGHRVIIFVPGGRSIPTWVVNEGQVDPGLHLGEDWGKVDVPKESQVYRFYVVLCLYAHFDIICAKSETKLFVNGKNKYKQTSRTWGIKT